MESTQNHSSGFATAAPLRTLKLKQMLNGAANHPREDVSKITDPKAQALFETTAEVLNGLVKAFKDFERKNEPAWKNPWG